jgi:hypothetical protein
MINGLLIALFDGKNIFPEWDTIDISGLDH